MRLDKNFPLSADLLPLQLQQQLQRLTYSAKELACHAIEAYVDRLNNDDDVECKAPYSQTLLRNLLKIFMIVIACSKSDHLSEQSN